MEQIDKYGRRSNENVRQQGRINLPKVSRKKTVLYKICQYLQKPACWSTAREDTFAMSSVFLNSPSMSVTFPSLSNSVHRSFSSFAIFPALLRPMLVPPTSSRKLGSGGRSVGFIFGFSFRSFCFHSLLYRGRMFVDARRLGISDS